MSLLCSEIFFINSDIAVADSLNFSQTVTYFEVLEISSNAKILARLDSRASLYKQAPYALKWLAHSRRKQILQTKKIKKAHAKKFSQLLSELSLALIMS